jgi:hypothetical protein
LSLLPRKIMKIKTFYLVIHLSCLPKPLISKKYRLVTVKISFLGVQESTIITESESRG